MPNGCQYFYRFITLRKNKLKFLILRKKGLINYLLNTMGMYVFFLVNDLLCWLNCESNLNVNDM